MASAATDADVALVRRFIRAFPADLQVHDALARIERRLADLQDRLDQAESAR